MPLQKDFMFYPSAAGSVLIIPQFHRFGLLHATLGGAQRKEALLFLSSSSKDEGVWDRLHF